MKESQNIEYKEIWKDEYLKWVSGFANATGKVTGVNNEQKLMEDIPNKIVNYLGIDIA